MNKKVRIYDYIPIDRDDAKHVLFSHWKQRYPDKAYLMLVKEDLIELCKYLQEYIWLLEDQGENQ